jgi:hypothetical protein
MTALQALYVHVKRCGTSLLWYAAMRNSITLALPGIHAQPLMLLKLTINLLHTKAVNAASSCRVCTAAWLAACSNSVQLSLHLHNEGGSALADLVAAALHRSQYWIVLAHATHVKSQHSCSWAGKGSP